MNHWKAFCALWSAVAWTRISENIKTFDDKYHAGYIALGYIREVTQYMGGYHE